MYYITTERTRKTQLINHYFCIHTQANMLQKATRYAIYLARKSDLNYQTPYAFIIRTYETKDLLSRNTRAIRDWNLGNKLV